MVAMSVDQGLQLMPLFVSVPVACFRAPQAREYLETLPLPPPSTVYGMLLSLVGETNRLAHLGAEMAFGLLGEEGPPRSTVLRTVWRVKSLSLPPGTGANARPDYQELLTDVRLVVWCRPGERETASPTLSARIASTIANPGETSRFGGLSLGESTHLVDEVRPYRTSDGEQVRMLLRRAPGTLSLPVWVDHVGSSGTVSEQFVVEPASLGNPAEAPHADAWIPIGRERGRR